MTLLRKWYTETEHRLSEVQKSEDQRGWNRRRDGIFDGWERVIRYGSSTKEDEEICSHGEGLEAMKVVVRYAEKAAEETAADKKELRRKDEKIKELRQGVGSSPARDWDCVWVR